MTCCCLGSHRMIRNILENKIMRRVIHKNDSCTNYLNDFSVTYCKINKNKINYMVVKFSFYNLYPQPFHKV